MRFTTAFGIVALLSAVLVPASDAQDSDALQAIESGNAAYIEAMANADANSFAMVYDEDGARLSGGGETIRGRSEIRNQIGAFFTRIGPVTATLETTDIWRLDDRIYETGAWSYTFTPPGDSRRTIGGRYVTVWKLQEDGSWKILVDVSVPGDQ
ncbi:MAG: SgcJ/EcaC family oxidoreductase [Rhodothermia bacterium]|nr:SgcJ/EcaC family oxidoreductase [Rhodothermia bacterium]